MISSGFPSVSVIMNPATNAGNLGLIPGSRRSPREGNGNTCQYSCRGNPMDRGGLQGCNSWGCKKSGTQFSD